MSFREKISILLDVDNKGGVGGFKAFGTSIRDADGMMGKFKAGATSAMDSVKANAGAFALAGGAALVAFGVKALGAFTDVAMGARDLGAATGLAVEDASRWIAVADDMGLSAGDLTAGLGAVTKSLDDVKWKEYGIATRDASGEARDANDILLDTFDVLSKETNLTERARLGKELLGRGYASLAPLIGKSRAEYEKMFSTVESGQVITQKELEKAQRMAKAQDSLSDALNEVTLAFGQAATELAPLIEGTTSAVTWFSELDSKVKDVTDGIGVLEPYLDVLGKGIRNVGYIMGEVSSTFDNGAFGSVSDSIKAQIEAQAKKQDELAEATAATGEATDKATTAIHYYSDAANEAKIKTDNLRKADGDLAAALGALDDTDALLNLQQGFDDLKQMATDNYIAVANGSMTAEEANRNLTLATDDQKRAVAEYGTEVAKLPAEQVTKMVVNMDLTNIDAFVARLALGFKVNVHAGLIADSALRNLMEDRGAVMQVRAGQK